MTENGSESLPFEPPKQENVRLRAENARPRRLQAVHSIPIPQLAAENQPPTKTVETALPVDREERARKRIALFRTASALPDGRRKSVESVGIIASIGAYDANCLDNVEIIWSRYSALDLLRTSWRDPGSPAGGAARVFGKRRPAREYREKNHATCWKVWSIQ
jgi:hypothetical protein